MTAARPSPARSADVLREAEWALTRALIPRGGRRHLRTCLARHVNSQPVDCSEPCLRAQRALARLTAWIGARQPAPEQQVRMEVTG